MAYCRSTSQYGSCRRPGRHLGPHAVPIGDGVWYGYASRRDPLGYGHLNGDVFTPLEAAARSAEDGGRDHG